MEDTEALAHALSLSHRICKDCFPGARNHSFFLHLVPYLEYSVFRRTAPPPSPYFSALLGRAHLSETVTRLCNLIPIPIHPPPPAGLALIRPHLQ
ncbi:hypothetical protein CKAH01_03630 [Colletotrichum kahawae]|uniref:Uncharacterized protein n=1 Tax=Colletotrichum kahawae TaxID=34407 RepID=A0AAE0DBV1_COLKA|nr:hypothetical protein CKAH01_03630 [Colletotrichum kahawae]